MKNKRRIAFNVVWNWAGMAVNMLGGFVVAPFLIHTLGKDSYGSWCLIGSLTSYFGLLDLGIRGSVGRNMAFFRARGDREGVNGILSTALVLLSLAAGFVLAGTLAVTSIFFYLFAVPLEQAEPTRLALAIICINLAVTILFSVFDAALWSFERFDILNAIDIPSAVLRVGLTFLLVDGRDGLVVLAVLTLLSTIMALGTKAFFAFRVERGLRIGPAHVTRAATGALVSFGCWAWLLSATRILTTQLGPMVTGARLGVGAVTPFMIASRLVGYATQLLIAATGVLTPVATALCATEQKRAQQQLVLEGGKLCLSASFFFLIFFLLLGDSFLHAWVGAAHGSAYQLLVILALGECLPLGLWVASSTLLGMGRHRFMACAGLIESLGIVLLATLLVDRLGLVGMGIALAVPGFLCRGVIQLLVVCNAVSIGLTRYVRQSIFPASAAALLPAGALFVLTSCHAPVGWLELVVYSALYAACWALSALLFSAAKWRQLVRRAPAQWLQGTRASNARPNWNLSFQRLGRYGP